MYRVFLSTANMALYRGKGAVKFGSSGCTTSSDSSGSGCFDFCIKVPNEILSA